MWFGTERELYRYDSRTFKKYKHDPKDPHSIASDYVHKIYQDSKGKLWMAAGNNGLCLYIRESDSFTTFRHDRNDPGSLTDDNVKGIVEDKENNLWVATALGLNRIIFKGDSVKMVRHSIDIPYRIECIVADPNGELWLGTTNGLFKFKSGKAKPVGQTNKSTSYSIYSAHLDKRGSLWLGTSRGLVKLNTATEEYDSIGSLERNSLLPVIYGIAEDRNNKLWLASESGLAFFDPETSRVKWYLRDKTNPNALVDDALLTIYIDQQQGLWVGTYYQGISYMNTNLPDFSLWPVSSSDKLSDFYLAAKIGKTPKGKLWAISANYDRIWISGPGNTESFSTRLKLPIGHKYYAFFLDDSGVLWCGGNDCLFIKYDLKTGKVLRYSPRQVYQGTPLPDTKILVLFADKRGRIWISGWLGLVCFDPQTSQFRRVEGTKSVHSILEDSKGNLWFSGEFNIYLLEPNSSKIKALKVSALAETGNQLYAGRIAEDDSGKIWATTNNGLLVYDNKNHIFLPYTNNAPELLNYTRDLQIDSRGNLWLCSEYKLICYHPDKKSIKVYDYRDGLPYGGLLLSNASLKDNQGNLYFSTNEGTFRFNPGKITDNTTAAPLALTSLKLFNKEVKAGDRTALLDHAIEMTREITFRHDQNIFTLDFALLSNGRSEMNRYAYFLENFENGWNYVQSPSATYTNLPPGNYMFLAKAANGDGYWNPKPLRLKITILPPWWKTWYAYITYFLLSAAGIYLLTRFFWLRTTLKKDNELYQAKLDFFTNISHEIRTHLSLISGPVEKAFSEVPIDSAAKNHLTYARNNSGKLMQLVNELLDFRKIQNGSVRLHISAYDVTKILKNVMASFEHLAAEKGIETQLNMPDEPVMLWLDLSQIQKVFYNLLSNAYKFTQEGGKVWVDITSISNEVIIRITDNGAGIAPENLDNIFRNFFQVGNPSVAQAGSGIGLALSKEIIDLHQGDLTVSSRLTTPDQDGETCFKIRLLTGKRQYSGDQLAEIDTQSQNMILSYQESDVAPGKLIQFEKSYTVLLIEDNDELRAFEKEIFGVSYHVLDAPNGVEGLKMAFEHLPDLILCDVMMPELSGVQVCRQLKSDIRTSHIPVILLTARGESSQVLEGLDAGADDYLLKPFDPHILDIKVSNMIKVREELRRQYLRSISSDTDLDLVNTMDSQFISKLSDLVIVNLAEKDFGVNEMALQIGMSVSALYRKLRALTGMTVNDFIKMSKMKRAFQLLELGNHHVNEVAFLIGYEDSKYFSREFKKIYGKSPSQLKKLT